MDESNPNSSAAASTIPAIDEADRGLDAEPAALSKSARKKLAKKERLEARKVERKAAEKERRKRDVERRRREWEEALATAPEEERERMIEARRTVRRERVGHRNEERGLRNERLRRAAEGGQKVVIDLEFADLMTPNEIQSLVHQVMYCYAVNGRSATPAHLWLTGCQGEINTNLQKLPGLDKWIIEKESGSYIEAMQEQKDNLVYLTADAETTLEELDPKSIYIIGGLVDRNRWKGITMKKATDQGIRSAKLPIGNYLKMSSSQVLTVNQVVEILLKFMETRDWKTAFFHVIPQRKLEVESQIEEEADEAEGIPAEFPVPGESEDDPESDSAEENGGSLCKKRRIKEVEKDAQVIDGEEKNAVSCQVFETESKE